VQALKQLPREQVQVATKFGLTRDDASGAWTVCGRPEYVRACCEASLRRLDAGYIDLYYQHRIDTTVPIEDTVCVSWPPCRILILLAAVAVMNYCVEIAADW